MIEAKSSTDQVRRVYNLWSSLYGPLAEPFERRAKLMALEKAAIQPHDKVLEVAVGPGKILLEILSKVDPANTVQGMDALGHSILVPSKYTASKGGGKPSQKHLTQTVRPANLIRELIEF